MANTTSESIFSKLPTQSIIGPLLDKNLLEANTSQTCKKVENFKTSTSHDEYQIENPENRHWASRSTIYSGKDTQDTTELEKSDQSSCVTKSSHVTVKRPLKKNSSLNYLQYTKRTQKPGDRNLRLSSLAVSSNSYSTESHTPSTRNSKLTHKNTRNSEVSTQNSKPIKRDLHSNKIKISANSFITHQAIKEMIYSDPKFHQKISRLKKMFKKVVLVIRVTLICKKLISDIIKIRKKSFLEELIDIRDQINQKQIRFRKMLEETESCVDKSRTQDEVFETSNQLVFDKNVFKTESILPTFHNHKRLRHLLCLPQKERYIDEFQEIQTILELKFSNNSCQWTSWPKQVRNEICKLLRENLD